MIDIETLSLHFPAGFEHRSENILKHLTESLGLASTLSIANRAVLIVPEIYCRTGETDREIGESIAKRIIDALTTYGGANG